MTAPPTTVLELVVSLPMDRIVAMMIPLIRAEVSKAATRKLAESNLPPADPVVAGAVAALAEIKANPKTKTDPVVAYQVAARALVAAQEEFYAAQAAMLNIQFTKLEQFEDDPHLLDPVDHIDPFAYIPIEGVLEKHM
jgi:hypothetical protein